MKISEHGISELKKSEGVRLSAYQDGGGVWTIGYGHTGADVKKGLKITQERADELFKTDLDRFERAVSKLVTVTLNQNQFDALVSFTYNLGEHALAGSTLLRKLNAGDYAGAAAQFKRWNKDEVKGKLVANKGLTARRKREAGLFLS